MSDEIWAALRAGSACPAGRLAFARHVFSVGMMFRKRKRIGRGRSASPAGLSGLPSRRLGQAAPRAARTGSSVVSKPMKQHLSPCRLARQETKFGVENAPSPGWADTERQIEDDDDKDEGDANDRTRIQSMHNRRILARCEAVPTRFESVPRHCWTRFGPKSCIIMHNPASLASGSHCLRGKGKNHASLASGSHCLREVPCILAGRIGRARRKCCDDNHLRRMLICRNNNGV